MLGQSYVQEDGHQCGEHHWSVFRTGASGDQGENIGGSLRVGFSEFERTEKENDGK